MGERTRFDHFRDLWREQRLTATLDQKNRVGIAYLTKCIGLNSEEIRDLFNNKHGDTSKKLEKVMRDLEKNGTIRAISSAFWEEIDNIFPGVYSSEDRTFLVNEGNSGSIDSFIVLIEPRSREVSIYMKRINEAAHLTNRV